MSITPPGLVSGPALLPQPSLIQPVAPTQPVDTSSQSKADSGTSRQQDGASAFLSRQPRGSGVLTYGRPAAAEAPTAQGFVSATASSGTASADVAAVNGPTPAAPVETVRNAPYAAANAAYAMVADVPAGMPPSILTPLRDA
ncbi:MAG: hypothetical protein QM690_08875 [Sphingobium sp.]